MKVLLFLSRFNKLVSSRYKCDSSRLYIDNVVWTILFQAHSYNGETLLAQDKCGEAIRGLQESVKCEFYVSHVQKMNRVWQLKALEFTINQMSRVQ